MPVYEYRHRVRFRECDPMGVVYHTHYLDYFEFARTEALRDLGVAYAEIQASGTMMPVIEAQVRYRKSAFYDDLLVIACDVGDEVPTTRLTIGYTVRRDGESAVLATGSVTLCFVDMERGRPVQAPPRIREAFERALAE